MTIPNFPAAAAAEAARNFASSGARPTKRLQSGNADGFDAAIPAGRGDSSIRYPTLATLVIEPLSSALIFLFVRFTRR
jgi:hypothetical protein